MKHPQDFIHSYIGSLLEEPALDKPAPQPIAESPEPVQETLTEQVHSLEEEKRRQLQKLLNTELKVAPEVPPEPVAEPEIAEQEITVETTPPVIEATVAAPAEPIPSEPVPEPPAPEVVTEAAAEVHAQVLSPLLAWAENGRPVWAQEHFDVLLFEVSGLTLAVPLIALGQIYPMSDDLTPIFGQADWFMGLQNSPQGNVRCINTALFVMPERYNPDFLESVRYVITIDGMDWGLAVDAVHQPRRLSPEDVTWRSSRSKRPWLAGTVKSAMCALIDIPQMGSLLQSSDRKRRA